MVWTEPKYPTDLPKFTPEDKYRDPVALLEYREAVARRKQIDVEKARVRILLCGRRMLHLAQRRRKQQIMLCCSEALCANSNC